ncbi:Conserved_hypothetical protein [Hexamita inflata]|uniref:Uncharacterized protein n=1 Tax=Hexamita inflata TaxID=28002 RepID=A0AA86TXG1_9EUKA|nr:Conserved hypothetical protein [Hexamita inflata]
MQLIITTLNCDMTSTLTSVQFDSFKMILSRPAPCPKLYEPRYHFVNSASQPIFRFVLNTQMTTDLRSASGLEVQVRCNPSFQLECAEALSEMKLGHELLLQVQVDSRSLTLENNNYVEKTISATSTLTKTAPVIDQLNSIELSQNASMLTFTLSSAQNLTQSSVQMTCMTSNKTSLNSTDLDSALLPAQLMDINNNTTVSVNCTACNNKVVYYCNVQIDSNTYFDIHARQILKSVQTSILPIVIPLVLLVVVGIIVFTVLMVKKNNKTNVYSKPVKNAQRTQIKKGSVIASADSAKMQLY